MALFEPFWPFLNKIIPRKFSSNFRGINKHNNKISSKDILTYIEQVEAGVLPVAKGYSLNKDEQVTREVIEMLMCNYRINWQELSQQLSLSVEEVKRATAYDEKQLDIFAADGLITYDTNHIEMTTEGRLFVRNIAASLDKLMIDTNKSFSKTV